LYFDGGSQLPQQILWKKFHIRCAYFTPNCTWSLNYSVLVKTVFCVTHSEGYVWNLPFRRRFYCHLATPR
jgi:hypothetical protein